MNLRALILCAAACGAASSRGPAAGQELAPADPAAAFLAAGDPLARERARRVLIGREEGAAKVLCAALASADPHLCETALLTLAECPAPDLDPGLLAALEDGDRSLRIAALKALAARGAASLHPAVLAAARAEHWAERRAAALALARTRAEEAVPPLCALAADPDRDVSEAALRGLLVAQTDAACDALRASFDAADVERGERILVCLARRGSAQDAAFFEEVLDAPCDDRLRVLAAAALAARGARPLAGPRLALLLRCSASGDPRVGRPAAFALARDPAAAGAALLEGLPGAAPQEAGAWADLAVGLLGPAARGPLLAVARGETPATDEARAAAVHALRRFRTAETANDLLWIYSPELPRALREELCGAFEDLPRHPAARSGLLQLLEDGEGNLRLRAFRVLLQYGASAPEEIAWLLERVLEEKVDWVRQRMCRLLATYARGDGARAFAERMIDALGAPEPFRSDARDALENLSQSALKRRAAQAVLARSGENLDFPTLRLLTRLEGEEADSAVARALQRALLQGDADLAVRLLVALRAGGGPGIAGALRLALESDAAPVRDEALRALLARGDEQALDTFARLYDRLDGAARAEFLGLVRCDDAERLALLFQDLLAREQDDLIAQAIVENAGQERAPIAGALVDLLRTPRTAEFTACAAEALASIGGAAAEEAVCGLFQEQLARTLASGMRAPDDRLLIESLARSAARTGRSEVASGLAALLFHRVAELEALQYDVDAAFPFEMTIMQALLDLALACGDAAHVAATVEVEMDRRARGGDLFLLPKALFARLVLPLEELEAARAARTHGAPDEEARALLEAFAPLRAALLDLAVRLPPRAGKLELAALTWLARRATAERDHERAAALIEQALLLIDLQRVEGERFLREKLGAPDPLTGFDTLPRLRADLELARARARRVMGADAEALARYDAALACAPCDAWLLLQVAAELAEDGLAAERAREQTASALEFAPWDADLLERAADVSAACGDAASFERARAALGELNACGLARDSASRRLGLALACLLLGRQDEARAEVQAALLLDPDAAEDAAADPRLAPLLND